MAIGRIENWGQPQETQPPTSVTKITEEEALHLERLDYLQLREGMHGTAEEAAAAGQAWETANSELAERYGADLEHDIFNLRTREIRRGVR